MFPIFGGYRRIPVPFRWPQGWPAPLQPPLTLPQQQAQAQSQAQPQSQPKPQPQPQPQQQKAAEPQVAQEGPWQVQRAAESEPAANGFLPVEPVMGVDLPHGARPHRRRRWW